MNDQTTYDTLTDEAEDAADAAIASRIKIDWDEIIASTEPDQPGGRIVFDSGDYATEKEADAALHAFFTEIIEGPYEED